MVASDEMQRRRLRFGIHGCLAVVGALAGILYTRAWLDSPLESPCGDWICLNLDFSLLLAVCVWPLFVCANLSTLPALIGRWKSGRACAIAYVIGLLVAPILATIVMFVIPGHAISRPLMALRMEHWHRRVRETFVLDGWHSAVDILDRGPFVAAGVTALTDMDLTFSAKSSALPDTCSQAPETGHRRLRKGERVEMRYYFACSQPEPLPIDMLAFRILGMRGADPELGLGVDFIAEPALTKIPRKASDVVLPLPPEQLTQR